MAELCQRGVIVPIADGDVLISQERLLESIQNAVGMVMMDKTEAPKLLVAGVAVVASMVVEKLADMLLLLSSGRRATLRLWAWRHIDPSDGTSRSRDIC